MTYPGCYVGVLVVRLIRPGPSRELNDEPDGVQYGQQKRVEKFLENQSSLLYITVNQCPLNRGGGVISEYHGTGTWTLGYPRKKMFKIKNLKISFVT